MLTNDTTKKRTNISTLVLCRDRKLDFVDALVAAIARERGSRVFSFDRDLENLVK